MRTVKHFYNLEDVRGLSLSLDDDVVLTGTSDGRGQNMRFLHSALKRASKSS